MRGARCAARALALAAAVAACPLLAAALEDFHAMQADAMRYYRGAVFYLRTGNAMVGGFELDQLQPRWQALTERYAESPPGAYTRAARFAAVLREVSARIGRARAAVDAGDVASAREALEPVRTTLAALRAQAGVRVFSDCMDEVSAAVDALHVYRRSPPDLADAAAAGTVKARARVAHDALERCRREAPAAVAGDGEFTRLLDGAVHSAHSLAGAVEGRDVAALVNILRELRSFERILFLKFG